METPIVQPPLEYHFRNTLIPAVLIGWNFIFQPLMWRTYVVFFSIFTILVMGGPYLMIAGLLFAIVFLALVTYATAIPVKPEPMKYDTYILTQSGVRIKVQDIESLRISPPQAMLGKTRIFVKSADRAREELLLIVRRTKNRWDLNDFKYTEKDALRIILRIRLRNPKVKIENFGMLLESQRVDKNAQEIVEGSEL